MARRRHLLGRTPRRLTSCQSHFVRAARPLGRVSARAHVTIENQKPLVRFWSEQRRYVLGVSEEFVTVGKQ